MSAEQAESKATPSRPPRPGLWPVGVARERLELLRPRLIDGAFAAGWGIVPKLPRALADAAFDAVGTASALRPGSYQQLRRNLRQVIGPQPSERELDQLVRRAVVSYTRYWREAFQTPSMDPNEVARRTETIGLEHVRRAMAGGRGVVVALTHSGNWDTAAVVLTKVHKFPMTTVAERLEPESLFHRFVRFRESLGMHVVPLTGGAEPSTLTLKRALQAGHMVTLLADRDLQANGIEVTLCGARTTMPSGPALLALQTGAALLPLDLGFTANGWRMEFLEEIKMPEQGRLRDRVTSGVQQLAEIFTGVISRAPQDWHMLQKIWPDI